MLDESDTAQLLNAMRAEAMEVVLPIARADSLKESCRAYMRYVGQGFEIAVSVSSGGPTAIMLAQAFETQYRELYDRIIPGQRMEILSWTLSLSTTAPDIPLLNTVPAEQECSTAEWFDGARIEPVQRVRREGLMQQGSARGPLLVFEDQTTTVIPTGFDLRVDEFGQLVIQQTGEQGQ
jgi:N-methylhydantoinase A